MANTDQPSYYCADPEKMGREYCCVPCCNNDARNESGKGKSFHQFPKDLEMRKLWIVKIRRDEGPLFQVSRAHCQILSNPDFPFSFKMY